MIINNNHMTEWSPIHRNRDECLYDYRPFRGHEFLNDQQFNHKCYEGYLIVIE